MAFSWMLWGVQSKREVCLNWLKSQTCWLKGRFLICWSLWRCRSRYFLHIFWYTILLPCTKSRFIIKLFYSWAHYNQLPLFYFSIQNLIYNLIQPTLSILKFNISLIRSVSLTKEIHINERKDCNNRAEQGCKEREKGNCSFAIGGAPGEHDPPISICKVSDWPNQKEYHRNKR